MADVELVIKIPDDIYEQAINGTEYDTLSLGIKLRQSVQEGVVIPKGHGRLKDADKIANEVNALKDNWNRYGNEYESGRYESYDYAVDTIDSADTIVEADKESEE